jgi:hypothetical protein
MHGILLLCHRQLIEFSRIKKLFEILPKFSVLIGWLVTQYFIFMTWLVFRVEDTSMMIRSLKTFVGYDAHWDVNELVESLPDVKLMTIGLVGLFIIVHAISGKLGGLKMWLSKQNSLIWGAGCGILLAATFLLRPAETVEFIYFRF